MAFYGTADDLPQTWKPKRIIFYAQGLKIYGQIPYILQRRLRAEFFSNNAPFMGARIIAPTAEPNYTLVPYRRQDGQGQSDSALKALLDWLYADKGFEWAVAVDFYKEIDLANFYNMSPDVYSPGQGEQRPILRKLLEGK